MREVTEAEFAVRKVATDHQLAMRDMLTPEQKQKMQELAREMRGQQMGPGMGAGRGPMGPRPPQPPRPPEDKPEL
jgi:Spy/CpxP family protein refolding chaperone